MDNNLVLLLLLTPFVGFLFNIFFGKKAGKGIAGAIGTGAVAVSFAMSVYFFMQLNATGKPVSVTLLDWIQIGKLKVDLGILLDQLSLLWLLFVTGIGSLIHLYSISYMHDDEKYAQVFCVFKSIRILHDYFSSWKQLISYVYRLGRRWTLLLPTYRILA